MTDAKVTITLIDPTMPEQQFVFDEPRTCVVGRETDCDIALAADFAHREISRHHCLLDIKPPYVRVRYLNSTNGTFVNNERLVAERTTPEDTASDEGGTAILHDGDVIRVAQSLLRVHIESEAAHLSLIPADQPTAEPASWLRAR